MPARFVGRWGSRLPRGVMLLRVLQLGRLTGRPVCKRMA